MFSKNVFKNKVFKKKRIPHELIIQESSRDREPTWKHWVFWLLVPLVFIGLLVITIKSTAAEFDEVETGQLIFKNVCPGISRFHQATA